MNIDVLLLDIIKDKSKGNFKNNVTEVMETQHLEKEAVLRLSIESWFGIKATERYLKPANKTQHSMQVHKNIREILPYHTQVKPKLYLHFLKKHEREAMLSNIDD